MTYLFKRDLTSSLICVTHLLLFFSPAVLAGPSSQRAAGQRVEVGDFAQRPGGHGETLAGGGGAEAAHRPVQAALAEAWRLERSPGVRHCAGSSQRYGTEKTEPFAEDGAGSAQADLFSHL